jgi:biotin carboxyl carrier protein
MSEPDGLGGLSSSTSHAESPDLDVFVATELPKIVNLLQRSRVRELEWKSGTTEISIQRARRTTDGGREEIVVEAAQVEIDAAAGVKTITSPMVGVFYHSEQPGRAALVEVGAHIERGALIGVIEALQVLTEVESDATGVVQRIVAADGEPVEFGQPLVEVLVEA